MQGRGNTGERRGGDSTVEARLSAALEALGHEVVISPTPPRAGAGSFDVVHAINLDRSVLPLTESFARAAIAAGARLVVTPLWWPLKSFIDHLSRRERWAFLAKELPGARVLHERSAAALRSVRQRQAAVLAAAQVVCPSGRAESFALQDAFGPLPTTVVPFGTAVRPAPQEGPREGVLCVARLDPRKNQLALIEALRGTGLSLRLVGTEQIFPEYARACRQAAGSDVEFSGFLADDEVEHAHRRARVHALPSFFELPGLTSLDAAVAGAVPVVGRGGTAGDYLGQSAFYCGPDRASIRRAVLAAYEAGPDPGLPTRLASEFSWDICGDRYLAAYQPG